jgi:protein-disulfide isomerase
MHDALFAKGGDMGAEQLKARAAEIGLDATAFAACLDGGKQADRVAADQALAQKLGVQGTPNFFIGKADPADPDKVTLVQRIPGAVGYPVFAAAIDALLKPAAAAPAEAAAEAAAEK